MRSKFQLSIESAPASPRRRHHFGPPLDGAVAHRHTPQTAHALEGAENFGFVPLDRFHGIQHLRKRIATRLRVENLGQRFPCQRLAARNNGGFRFRNRVEHRERIFRQLCASHLSRIVLRLLVLAREADRVHGVSRKIKRGKRRFSHNAHLPVGIHHIHLEQGRRRRRCRRQRCRPLLLAFCRSGRGIRRGLLFPGCARDQVQGKRYGCSKGNDASTTIEGKIFHTLPNIQKAHPAQSMPHRIFSRFVPQKRAP